MYSHVALTCEKNIALVVSLLINLMKDQASHLNSRGISAISLSLNLLQCFDGAHSSLRTKSNSKIIAGSHSVARVHECHILSVNLNGQQTKQKFGVTEINL